MGLNDIDLQKLEALLKLSRSENVLQLKIGEVEFTLAPTLPSIPAMTEMDPEDLGLPEDPGDPSLMHTTPYVPVGMKPEKPSKRRKPRYSEDGEVMVDPENPLNPNNPVDFAQDFPDLPPVPGYGNGR